jgi:hypothetical protein
MNGHPSNPRQPDLEKPVPSTSVIIPAFERSGELIAVDLRFRFAEACAAWLAKSPSLETRSAYARELAEFLRFARIPPDHLEQLATLRPQEVAAWRDHLCERGLANTSIVRKITVLRSLYSYLQTYGFTGANPAHADFVAVPAVWAWVVPTCRLAKRMPPATVLVEVTKASSPRPAGPSAAADPKVTRNPPSRGAACDSVSSATIAPISLPQPRASRLSTCTADSASCR